MMAYAVGSRAERWDEAVGALSQAYRDLDTAAEEAQSALDLLQDLQREYQDWFDNMPDFTQDGPTGEKLSQICEIDLSDEGFNFVWLEDVVDEVKAVDLPGEVS
jgi:hypothetical protein